MPPTCADIAKRTAGELWRRAFPRRPGARQPLSDARPIPSRGVCSSLLLGCARRLYERVSQDYRIHCRRSCGRLHSGPRRPEGRYNRLPYADRLDYCSFAYLVRTPGNMRAALKRLENVTAEEAAAKRRAETRPRRLCVACARRAQGVGGRLHLARRVRARAAQEQRHGGLGDARGVAAQPRGGDRGSGCGGPAGGGRSLLVGVAYVLYACVP